VTSAGLESSLTLAMSKVGLECRQQGHQPDDDGVDVLVDVRADERAAMASLNQGQRLSFEVVYDKRIGRSCAENLGASGLQAGAR
jgi:cold shock protein